jgi:hypothetical protein
VKSGGYAMFPGASNAPDGITLDLRYLNQLEISEGREAVFIGTGNRWADVYHFLNPWNLTASGGLDAQVGVGDSCLVVSSSSHCRVLATRGLVMRGSISYISREYGWGVDNVRNYEVSSSFLMG